MLDRLAPSRGEAAPPGTRSIPEFARGPVFAAMATLAVLLTAFSGPYGFHRDELYFLMLPPGWGYVDQPPLAPLLARLLTGALGEEPWAVRIPATVATVTSVLVLVLITRELGGGRGAQALCAWGYAFAAMPLIMGHALLTSTLDLPVWPAVVLCAMRAQLRREARWWLVAGVLAGVSMYNKLLVVVLIAAMAAGLALVGPRRILWSRWVLAAAALALVIGSPNLIYQATHDWPQLSMGNALAENNAGEVRIMMWPFLLLMLGPPLVPIWVAGLVGLVRRPDWRPVRFLAAAFPVLLGLVFLMGSQFYYPFGLLAALFAAGCVPAAQWVRNVPWRKALVVAAVAVNAAVSVVLGLPVIPTSALGDTPVPAVNQVAQDSVGWPTYVRQIAEAHATLPRADHSRAVIVTSNYGEAGAVDRYGARYGLPRAYSGQNQLYYEAQPPESATVVIIVGGQLRTARAHFASCMPAGRLDNGLGVDNEEQGEPIAICRDPIGGWDAVWPAFRHLD
ncbi:MAG TPA: glycosyltransferase family 39 protein [Micromonosporaceae bacterium]